LKRGAVPELHDDTTTATRAADITDAVCQYVACAVELDIKILFKGVSDF
jgi:hypothetical protein